MGGVALLAAVALAAGAPSAMAAAVIPGDHPDPSILRAGSGWYATTTSNDWLPAFPVLRSADLNRWRQVGSVLERRPGWAVGDFWAPELVRREGRVLAYYAALRRDGRRCIGVASAARLRGPYRDHRPIVCTELGAIDPLPVRDEHGVEWLLWKENGNAHGEPTPILAARLAPGGLALAGLPRELMRADAAWEGGLIEGAALTRHAGVFYLFYSARRCCGPQCNYATGVARSQSLLGPWEKRPDPLLEDGAIFRCPGHGSIATGPGGLPVFAYHAYARGDPANRHMLIARLDFGHDGWPELSDTGARRVNPPVERIKFHRDSLGQGWQWHVGLRPAVTVERGRLVLGPGVLARQAATTSLRAEVVVGESRRGALPGLAVMSSPANGVGVELRDGRAVAWHAQSGRVEETGVVRVGHARRVALRVAVGQAAQVSVRSDGRWTPVGERQPSPRWTGGPRVALRVTGPPGGRVAYEALRITPR